MPGWSAGPSNIGRGHARGTGRTNAASTTKRGGGPNNEPKVIIAAILIAASTHRRGGRRDLAHRHGAECSRTVLGLVPAVPVPFPGQVLLHGGVEPWAVDLVVVHIGS